jgi:hypothetical protein
MTCVTYTNNLLKKIKNQIIYIYIYIYKQIEGDRSSHPFGQIVGEKPPQSLSIEDDLSNSSKLPL